MNKNIEILFEEFKDTSIKQEVLIFYGFEGYDVYNITAPLLYKGERYIIGRVERRDSEDSFAAFFKQTKTNSYTYDQSIPTYPLQDPFFTIIDDEYLIGGVKTVLNDNNEIISWYTVFYKGKELDQLSYFFEGPKGMKDLRIHQLDNQDILVLTRPQGVIGGHGKIGAIIIDRLEKLSLEVIEKAQLLPLFNDEEWGGANALYNIDNNKVGVLGHVACFDKLGNRHYYSMTFELDYLSMKVSNYKLIATRRLFLAGPSKRIDLEDVIFSGGLDKVSTNRVNLYVGVSDAGAQSLNIAYPFSTPLIK